MRTTKRIEKGEGRQRENATQDEIARIVPLALLLLLILIRVVCHLQRHRADTLQCMHADTAIAVHRARKHTHTDTHQAFAMRVFCEMRSNALDSALAAASTARHLYILHFSVSQSACLLYVINPSMFSLSMKRNRLASLQGLNCVELICR